MITIKDLAVSPVIFDEGRHTYDLFGTKLSGITSLIHNLLGLGIYSEADEYVQGYLVPRAGSRGTAVHHAIQTFDELGIEEPFQIVRTTYYRNTAKEYVQDESWDVSYELSKYREHRDINGFIPLANEYTVSDERRYASQIDNIWLEKETGDIWLTDTKTTNIGLYPICGYYNPRYYRNGEEALKDYLSWQLSCYAYLFERQNPGMKVKGLACNWLRKDDSAFWFIERKPDDLVENLLSADCMETDNGFVYFHPDLKLFGITGQLQKADDKTPILPEDVIGYIVDLNAMLDEYKRKYDEAKEAIRKAMQTHNVTKADLGKFNVTLSADSVAKTFDTTSFRKDHPELYKQYLVEKEKKGSLILKFK